MNRNLFTQLEAMANAEGIDRYRQPELPPLDMSRDALLGIAAAFEPLARSLGLDAGVTVIDPLIIEPRTNAQIEMQIVNLQLGLMRAMLLLGYEWSRVESAMQRMIRDDRLTPFQNDTFIQNPTRP